MAPLVPVTRNVKAPVEEVAAAVIVRIDVAVPPEVGVMGVGSE
jgi:hypothetical protein